MKTYPASGVDVECYSGFTYAQSPRAVYWNGERQEVAAVEAAWTTPQGKQFWVRAVSGVRLALAYDAARDDWAVELI